MASLSNDNPSSIPEWKIAMNAKLAATPCKFYKFGTCLQANNCVFLHDPKSILPPKPRPPDPIVTLNGPPELTSILSNSLLTQWRGDGKQNAHLQGFHPRKAIMNPDATSLLLNLIHPANNKATPLPTTCTLLDPFIGSGTTAVECLRRGWSVLGTDISPTAIGIARCHSWIATQEEINDLKQTIELVVTAFQKKNIHVENIAATTEILQNIIRQRKERLKQEQEQKQEQKQDQKQKQILFQFDPIENTLHFLLDYEENRQDLKGMPDAACASWSLSKRYQRTAERYIEKLELFRQAVPNTTSFPTFLVHDAKMVLPISQELGLFDGIVTSPPYPGVYNYVEDENGIDSAFVRGSGSNIATNVVLIKSDQEIGSKNQFLLQQQNQDTNFTTRWQTDTIAWMSATTQVLRIGGRMVMLIGDNAEIDVLKSVKDAAEHCGGIDYQLVFIASASVKEENNERRPWGKQSRGYRTEHTILLEKRETL